MDKVLNALQQLNWVDVFVVIALLRIGYIGMKNGLATEFFKFLGTFLAIYVSLHYYALIADFIGNQTWLKKVPAAFLNLFSVIVLAVVGYLVFKFLRQLFLKFIQLVPLPGLDKWGGLILGITRTLLFTSLIIFISVISPWNYFRTSTKNSASGRYVFRVSPAIYTWLWNNITSKFMTFEEINAAIPKVQKVLDSTK